MSLVRKKAIKWRDEESENPLLRNQGLFDAALAEFSQKTYKEASLNDILRKVGMNKGSFYYRFYDKADLYLSLMHRIGIEKLAVFSEHFSDADFPSNFFDRIKAMAKLSLMFAKKDKRYYLFWKRYVQEGSDIRNLVLENFSEMGADTLAGMVSAARKAGQLNPSFSDEFVFLVVDLLLNNVGNLISPEMSDEEILDKVNELASFLKYGLSSR